MTSVSLPRWPLRRRTLLSPAAPRPAQESAALAGLDGSTFPCGFTRQRSPWALAVLALHVAIGWLLLQTDVIDRVLPTFLPVSVALLAEPLQPAAPEPALPLPSPLAARQAAPALPALMPPRLDATAAPASPAAATAAETARPAEAPGATAAVASTAGSAAPAVPGPTSPTPTPTSLPAPAPLPPSAEPRLLPPGAIRYRVPPAIAVPLASRRLRESGTVWLRVRVDRQGLPVQIVVHQSSGFPRLDEQAVVAMQAARFTPQTDNGLPIEWVVIAPLAYEVD